MHSIPQIAQPPYAVIFWLTWSGGVRFKLFSKQCVIVKIGLAT